MGTFLFEEITKEKPVFKDDVKGELQRRLIEILLDFGECALQAVEFRGKKIYIFDPKHLSKENDHYLLEYNRFENTTWEPSFMSGFLEYFTGIRSRSFGSKIGYRQHYIAMAVARVLCECYSEDGNYYVYGDIGTSMILECLAYIGKRYGYDLVRQFLVNRTDIDIMGQKPDFERMYLGSRADDFYINYYQYLDTFSEWEQYIKKNFEEDLLDAEKSEPFYCGTAVYLSTLLLKFLCERDLTDSFQLSKEEVLRKVEDFTQKYLIDTVQQGSENAAMKDIDLSQHAEAKKYCQYYRSIRNYMAKPFCDKNLFYETIVKFFHEGSKRNDAEEILKEYQQMLDEMVPDKERVENLQQYQEEWKIYHIVREKMSQDKRIQELMEKIQQIAEDIPDLRDGLIKNCYLRELMLNDTSPASMSDGLKTYLDTIFSEERKERYLSMVEGTKKKDTEDGLVKLFSIAEKLSEESVLFPSGLFYYLLKNSLSADGKKEIREEIEKIGFYLDDLSDADQKRAFLWCLQADEGMF